MAGKKNHLSDIRARLIDQLKNDEWLIIPGAEAEARLILAENERFVTQYSIIRFIIERLEEDLPFHEVGLGEPPGSRGEGYVMNVPRGKKGVYIKMRFENDKVAILSFHYSKHSKGS